MTPLVASRVARCAALLDEKAPGWAARVRPEGMDLSDPQSCLLKQISPRRPFGDSVVALGLVSRLVEHGLAIDGETWWSDLHGAWESAIAARRTPGGRVDGSDVR